MYVCEVCNKQISDWEYYAYDHKCDYCRWIGNDYKENESEEDKNEN